MQRTVRSIATGSRSYIQRNGLLNTILHIGYRLINYASLVLIFEAAVLLNGRRTQTGFWLQIGETRLLGFPELRSTQVFRPVRSLPFP